MTDQCLLKILLVMLDIFGKSLAETLCVKIWSANYWSLFTTLCKHILMGIMGTAFPTPILMES